MALQTETLRSNPTTYLDVARLEMQLPTQLRGDFKNYTAKPEWHGEDGAALDGAALKTLPGRADNRWDAYSYSIYGRAQTLFGALPKDQQAELANFRDRKRRFFARFAKHYSPFVTIVHETGLLGSGTIPKVDANGDMTFRIVSEHSLAVGKVAEILGTQMSDQLLAEKILRENIPAEVIQQSGDTLRRHAVEEVVMGALIQDVNKRTEIEFKKLAPEDQQRRIVASINAGTGATFEDLNAIIDNPETAAGIYERILQDQTKSRYKTVYGEELGHYGNVDTIIDCSKAAGMPVVDREQTTDGHYLPTLAMRIANFADKMVQDAGLVSDLGRRHEVSASRYSPREKVDAEYVYAARCADEFAPQMGLQGGANIPACISETLISQINTPPTHK